MQKFKIENIFKPRVTTVDLKIPYSFKFLKKNSTFLIFKKLILQFRWKKDF